MPAPHAHRPPRPRSHLRRALLGALSLAAAAMLLAVRPDQAAADVSHLQGFQATVDSFTSWYGSYGMASLGTAFCIDHGARSPDPDFGYARADLSALSHDVQSAVAWAISRHGATGDAVTHAAVMLATHDLMGAVYPSGRIDVDALTVDRLAGFDGHEAEVLTMARSIKADGLAHRHLRGPLSIALQAAPPNTAGVATVTARVTDAAGHSVQGVPVTLSWAGSQVTRTTGTTGSIVQPVRAVGTPRPVRAEATVPHLPLDAWASTTTPAQRIARPTVDRLEASVQVAPATGRIRVVKTGDAAPWLPVSGARFRIEPAAGGAALGRLTTGLSGATPELTLPIGRYRVVEEQAPPGYDAGGPWTVDVQPGQLATVAAANAAQRGRLVVRKVDADTGGPIAGASFTVRYDANADGSYEALVATLVTTDEPAVVEGLLPGRYEVVEVAAPSGYGPPAPARIVDVPAGRDVEIVVTNRRIPVATTTTAPPTTTTPARPPARIVRLSSSPAAPLPRTGADVATLALLGIGLVLIGSALLDVVRAPSAQRARRT